MTSSKNIFIISPIGPKTSEIRSHFDKVRKHIIDPVAKEIGYTTLRSDEIALPGRITSQIIEHLRNDELVIADLSRKNPNVYYELAIRHAVQKPVILIGESVLDIPFDLAAQRVISYSLDPDDIIAAKTQLMSQIESVESKSFLVDSPITDLINLTQKQTRSEGESIQRIVAILETQSHAIQQIQRNQSVGSQGFLAEAISSIREDMRIINYSKIPEIMRMLRPIDIDLLRFLSGPRENSTTRTIARTMDMAPSTISVYLKKLMELYLIHRDVSVRPYTYSLTDLGREILNH